MRSGDRDSAEASTRGAIYARRSPIAAAAGDVFDWHARPGALERLTPPWAPVRIEARSGGIEAGASVTLRLPLGPASLRWVAQHTDYVEGELFRDVQLTGPFARWQHTHRFEAVSANASILEDHVEYELPFGRLGAFLGGAFVRRMLAQMFAYRHRITAGDVAAHARYRALPRQHFLVTGASGLVGSALVPYLTTGGHQVTRLRRGEMGSLPISSAVVHLAGENVAAARWSNAVKRRIRDSRVDGTRALCEALARLAPRPRVLVCASAVGYYGDRGAQPLDENDGPGDGFLAGVCREWEAATAPAAAAGIRVVHLRIGPVLSAAGGVLAKMLTPFRLGLGGRVGNGRQYMSWIALDDLLDAILHVSMHDDLEGSVNAVSPAASTNAAFTRTLGRVLRRPTWLAMPAPAARLAFGPMADEMLLASARVEPARLTASGFIFRTPTLEAALRHTLGRA